MTPDLKAMRNALAQYYDGGITSEGYATIRSGIEAMAAELEAEGKTVAQLQEKIDEWKTATMLSDSGGDSSGIEPEHLEDYIHSLDAELERCRIFERQFTQATEACGDLALQRDELHRQLDQAKEELAEALENVGSLSRTVLAQKDALVSAESRVDVFRSLNANAEKRMEEAESALAQAKEDTRRLDYLEDYYALLRAGGNRFVWRINKGGHLEKCWILLDSELPKGWYDSIREAIDAASQGGGGTDAHLP